MHNVGVEAEVHTTMSKGWSFVFSDVRVCPLVSGSAHDPETPKRANRSGTNTPIHLNVCHHDCEILDWQDVEKHST